MSEQAEANSEMARKAAAFDAMEKTGMVAWTDNFPDGLKVSHWWCKCDYTPKLLDTVEAKLMARQRIGELL